MIIELRGVEFNNKGAELMLHAIIERVKKELPGVIFAMESVRNAPRSKHLKNGIYTKIGSFQFKRYKKIKFFVDVSRIGDFLPASIRRKLFLIKDDEIDVVLDGSGFAFGDQWGADYAGRKLANKIGGWKKQGKKVVLLPQAFGPFKDERLKQKMRIIYDNSDLIFSRDTTSHNHLSDLFGRNGKIRLRPDFTNLLSGIKPSYFKSVVHDVAIIPNYKMITTTDSEAGNAYMKMLEEIAVIVQEEGRKPFFLIHEGIRDQLIAEAVNKKLKTKLTIVIDPNPLTIKGLIGNCNAVITSRFHGLVSSLAQAVPCLATGWSHKYERLLEDYNYGEALIDVRLSRELLKTKIQSILDEGASSAIQENLKKFSVEQKKLSEQMWDEVFRLIKA